MTLNALDAAVDLIAQADIPEALGVLERARARLWARLMTPPLTSSPNDDEESYLTADRVAELLGVSDRWVREHRKDLGGFGTRKLLRFSSTKVRRWIERAGK